MDYLLDRFAAPVQLFRPSNISELFAFRLAQKLDDAATVHHYLRLMDNNSRDRMICAYRRVIRAGNRVDIGRHFLRELHQLRSNGNGRHQPRLISLRIERRAVAAAVFVGEHLEFTDARQLSSVEDKALASAVGFLNWLQEHFAVESVALETIPTGQDFRRRAIDAAVRKSFSEQGVALWQVSKADLFKGYGDPALKSREDLRSVATTIWPVLSEGRSRAFIQDAVALGIYVQIERLFIIN